MLSRSSASIPTGITGSVVLRRSRRGRPAVAGRLRPIDRSVWASRAPVTAVVLGFCPACPVNLVV